jgi:2'-5' RNA ligase
VAVEPTQTALIVPVPEAEPVVGRFRASLDLAASWGVPAHVTVLYPFLPPERVDHVVRAALRDIVAVVPRTEVSLTRVDWFGDEVVWLAPEPDQLFRDLTAAVWRRFPDAPPYAGAHAEVVPHLTIGHNAPRVVLAEAAQAVCAHLPIRTTVTAVHLIAGTPDHPWHPVTRFPLGGLTTTTVA